MKLENGAGGSGSPNWWRQPALLLALVISGISIAGYVELSMTVNGLPPYRPYPGWVAVLQPVSEVSGDQVQLMVLSDAAGAHPLVGYTVVACGPHPYSADLLIGGSAQLTDIRPIPSQIATLLPAPILWNAPASQSTESLLRKESWIPRN